MRGAWESCSEAEFGFAHRFLLSLHLSVAFKIQQNNTNTAAWTADGFVKYSIVWDLHWHGSAFLISVCGTSKARRILHKRNQRVLYYV